jgi:8-oxo-dGTP pyrophosphatase MutT (NUDIX family)
MLEASIARLRRALAGRKRKVLERPERAAVLVPIVDDGAGLRLLLTRRTENLPSHQGHVAFPGGFMQPGERNPVVTALREAEEEIGLPPVEVDVLGLLDDFVARGGSVVVSPVVGRLARLPGLRPSSGEVARIFTIPIEELARPERWQERVEASADGPQRLAFFEHDGETLWGLSARVVMQLLDLLRGAGL